MTAEVDGKRRRSQSAATGCRVDIASDSSAGALAKEDVVGRSAGPRTDDTAGPSHRVGDNAMHHQCADYCA
jgi:hypothetical protein